MLKEAKVAKALGTALAKCMSDLDALRVVHFLSEFTRHLELPNEGEFLLTSLTSFQAAAKKHP